MARAHLVGSSSLEDPEAVFRTVARECGDSIARIPDGESGPRANWIGSMIRRLHATPGLAVVGESVNEYSTRPSFGLAEGATPDDVQFDLGLDSDGIASWPTFKALKDEGVIGPDVKFQLGTPTALAIVGNYICERDRAALAGPYKARLRREIENVAAKIPNDELAIQWEVAVEIGMLEGAFGRAPLPAETIIGEIVELTTLVPESVDMGFHLCYGNMASKPGERGRHFVEPRDTALLVRVANAICAGSPRDVHWIHMPVPIDRDDDAYFEPLEDLRLRPETELFLGLIHDRDGLEGAQRRISAALRHVDRPFGVATECGQNKVPREDTPALLRLHRDAVVGEPARA